MRYSADLDEIMDHRKNLIFGLETEPSEKSKFRFKKRSQLQE